jgi:hypothetical protein
MELTEAQKRMPFLPLPCFAPRARREVNVKDQINSLHVEQWQTDAPSLQNDRPDVRGQRAFMDMNPINTRTDFRSYLQAQPFVPNTAMDSQALGQNPFFEKYDITTDPTNVARELRASVYEERTDRGLLESKRLLSRTYTTRYVTNEYVTSNNLDTLNAYDTMKPRLNKMDINYRK